MKKKLALTIATAMLLTLLGCGPNKEESTFPTEVTVPTTTEPQETMLPETTPPVELTVEMHPFYETLISTGFQYSRGELEYYSGSSAIRTSDVEFLYTGESNEINLVTMDMTLTLTEDWMNRVAIYQISADVPAKGSNNGYCYIINRDIIAANWGRESVSSDDLLGGSMVIDYICCLSAVSKDEHFDGDPREPQYAIYLGESDTHYYYMKTPDTQNPDGSELLHTRYALIDQIGEDAYWELVGDLVITEGDIPEMIEINNQIKTNETVSDQSPEGYTFSFFLYYISRYQAYCDYYIAPAGTEDWYPVFIDKDTIDWEHPRIPGAHKNDDVAVMRAFVAYDGPENTQWVLRIEFPNEDVGTDFPNIPQPYSYQWDTVFELQNNQTLLHLGFVPDYLTLEDDVETGAWYTPITEPMEFCESCPEHWRIPIG